MKNLVNNILIITVSFIFIACSATTQNADTNVKQYDDISYESSYKTYDGYADNVHYESMINYEKLANQAVEVIFKNNEIPRKLIVTDFVDLNSLKNKSAMGYILSNSVKNSLINLKKIKIIEAELSKNFKISRNGLRVLTRDIKDIKSKDFNVGRAIVGTYTYNEAEIVVFIKLIDLKSGLIEGSYTKSLPIGKSIKSMLNN